MSGVRGGWRWLTANVIDLWKGAAVATFVVPVLLIVWAISLGLARPVSWLVMVVAVALLPLTVYCGRRFADSYSGRDEGLPPLDQPPGAEPTVHVRRIE